MAPPSPRSPRRRCSWLPHAAACGRGRRVARRTAACPPTIRANRRRRPQAPAPCRTRLGWPPHPGQKARRRGQAPAARWQNAPATFRAALQAAGRAPAARRQGARRPPCAPRQRPSSRPAAPSRACSRWPKSSAAATAGRDRPHTVPVHAASPGSSRYRGRSCRCRNAVECAPPAAATRAIRRTARRKGRTPVRSCAGGFRRAAPRTPRRAGRKGPRGRSEEPAQPRQAPPRPRRRSPSARPGDGGRTASRPARRHRGRSSPPPCRIPHTCAGPYRRAELRPAGPATTPAAAAKAASS